MMSSRKLSTAKASAMAPSVARQAIEKVRRMAAQPQGRLTRALRWRFPTVITLPSSDASTM